MTMSKPFIATASIIVIVAIALGAVLFTRTNESTPGTFEPSLIYDPSDDRQVVGAYHNVFTGKVLEKLEPTPYDAVPQTQYSVEIVQNIKGDLKETVIVSQMDGFSVSSKDGEVPALQVGSTYLLATRLNPDTGWNVLSPHPSGVKLLSEDRNLPRAQLVEISQQDQRVTALHEAYKNEIIPSVDLTTGNAHNAYSDL